MVQCIVYFKEGRTYISYHTHSIQYTNTYIRMKVRISIATVTKKSCARGATVRKSDEQS
jgi:hypothetical protein